MDKGEIFYDKHGSSQCKRCYKILFKITILIVIILATVKYFSQGKDEIKRKVNEIDNKTLFKICLNSALPVTNINNMENQNTKETLIEPLKLALNMELKALSLSDKEKSGTIKNDKKDEENEIIQKAETGLKTEVQSSNVPNKYTIQYNGVKIKNEVKYKLTDEILKPDITVNKENILIFHTHSCESYTPSEKYQYKKTGNFRTTDKKYSVIRVGNELEAQLKSYGYNVIHDESYHDYPSYSGSYASSLKTVTKLLDENKNTDVVIDLHRDAIGDSTYAPTVKIGEEYAAQLMFVIGGNESSIKHENWAQNLKFAIKVQKKANELYPGLFKPIILRGSGYNQHVSKAATIIEVGATGNTLDQTLVSMKYLAKVLSEVVK